MPNLSLCMIVKDEQEVIHRCLSSVADLVDEIIIADTGSSDDTIAICRQFTPSVYSFQWQQDFAAARNYAFSKAGCEYILWLDADDIIDPEHHTAFLELKTRLSADVYFLPYHYAHDENGRPTCTLFRERIVKNDGSFEWKYPIHEVIHNIHGRTQSQEPIPVRHARTPKGMERDNDRNLRLLQHAIQQEAWSRDPRIWFYFARELHDRQRFHEAIATFERFLALPDTWWEERMMALFRIAQCHASLAKTDKEHIHAAETYARKAIALDHRWAEPFFVLAELAFERQEYQEAAFWFEKCLIAAPQVLSPVNTEVYNIRSYVYLVLCHDHLQQYEKAWHYNERALACKPTDAGLLQNRRYLGAQLSATHGVAWAHETPLLCIHAGYAFESWNASTITESGIGGSETAVAAMAQEFSEMGYRVVVCCNCPGKKGLIASVEYLPLEDFRHFIDRHYIDVFIASRYASTLRHPVRAGKKYLWLHDIFAIGNHQETQQLSSQAHNLDGIFCLSPWHLRFAAAYHRIPREKFILTGNGIDPKRFARQIAKEPNRFIYSSSPDRSLDVVLHLFPKIRAALPGATLHIYYGFDNLESTARQQGDQQLMARIEATKKAMQQTGVFYHGRVDQQTLAEAFLQSDIWFYPTAFTETFCITALEAQAAGTLCVCSDLAGLTSTVADRGLLLQLSPDDPGFEKYALQTLVDIQQDPVRKNDLLDRARQWAGQQSWRAIAEQWRQLFENGSAENVPAKDGSVEDDHPGRQIYPL